MPEALKIFDALDQLRKIAKYVDLAKVVPAFQRLAALFDGQPPLDSPGAAGVLVDEFVVAAHAVADATITDRDDAVVDGLAKLAGDATLRPILVGVLEWLLTSDEPERMPLVDTEAFTAAGIDFAAILAFFRELLALYAAWKGQ